MGNCVLNVLKMYNLNLFLKLIFILNLLICHYLVNSQLVNPCSSNNKDLFVCNIPCDPIGTQQSSTNGCECKPNVTGLKCNQCKPGFYGFDTGCRECDCGPKVLGFRCNQTTGECLCKPTVDGKQCLHIK